jgi:hypothetical protein
MIALQYRFNRLPVHSKIYYISYYNQMSSEEIRSAITIGENGELDPSGLQQDCLGMTPLHILACSTVQCLELYQFIVDMYPNNLIVEDAWGALPLLYAIWGDAPCEVVQLLVNSYQSLYPDHEFDWEEMVITLGRANAPTSVFRNLLGINIQQILSPEYIINWDHILQELATDRWATKYGIISPSTFRFLTRCSLATRINAIGVKYFRDAMVDDYWSGYEHLFNGYLWRTETITKLEYYESEYTKLKEMTSLMELALWKARIDDIILVHDNATGGINKKIKIDQSNFRLQCRINCGADQVVKNVLPYLLPPEFVRSYVTHDDNDV